MKKSKPLDKRQYETLAAFRYAVRQFLRFSEEAAETATDVVETPEAAAPAMSVQLQNTKPMMAMRTYAA